MTTLALLLVSFCPVDTVLRETCEVIEVNSFYDCEARLTFCQVIFWEANGRCRAWKMNNERKLDPVGLPAGEAGGAVWFVDDGKVRCVRGRTVMESHTQSDPEIYDREILPADKRRGLRQ